MIFTNLDNLPTSLGKKRKQPSSNTHQRSNMMINPLNLKHLNSIDDIDADMITLNLEDGVSPLRKQDALDNIALFLSYLEHSHSFIVIRTNSLGEGGDREIEFLNKFSFDAIRIPKVTSIDDIKKALSILDMDKKLHLSIETRESFHLLSSLGDIDSRVTTVYLGILDLLSDMGLPQSIIEIGNPTIDYILSKFLIDAKIAQLHPISFMFQEYNSVDVFERWCQRERSLGFVSKACLGPKQVDIANRVFGISQDEIKRALHIKASFEKSAKVGINGFLDDRYGFIDEPIYRDALLTLKES